MPQNEIQWLMFLFFAVGALGGCIYLAQLVADAVRVARIARVMSRRE
tara:strand:- start:54 stop:194 length:141 start_codon:yes stop_codon:yes gene_type:complete